MGWGSMLAGRAIAGRQMKKHRRKTDEMARKRAREREWARRDRERARARPAQQRLNEMDRERRRAEKEARIRARANAMPVIDDSFYGKSTEETKTSTVLLILLVGSLVVAVAVGLLRLIASEPNSALAILVIGVVVFVFYPRKNGDRNEAE